MAWVTTRAPINVKINLTEDARPRVTFPSRKASPPISCCQIILLGDRGTYVLTTYLHVWLGGRVVLQHWARAVRTLPAVPRSTQPSALRGTVNEYRLSGWVIIINCHGGCRRQQPTGGLTAQVRWLGLRVDGHLALFYILQTNRVNCHNDLVVMMTAL